MPQFDFFSFFVQIVWFQIAIVFFYLVYLKYFLQNLSKVIKLRNKIKVHSASLKKNPIHPNCLYDTAIRLIFSKKK